MSQNTPVVSMSDYARPIKKWFKLLLVFTVIGAVLGLVLLQFSGRAYVSEAEVKVNPIVSQTDDFNQDIDRQINTVNEETIASSERVAELAVAIRQTASDVSSFSDPQVLEAAALETVEDKAVSATMEKVTVEVIPDSHVLVVKATDANPKIARELAQSVAVAYLDFRKTSAELAQVQAREKLTEREVELTTQLKEIYDSQPIQLDEEGNPVGGPGSYLVISKQRELESIGQSFANMEASTVNPGELLVDAALPKGREGLPSFAGPIMGGLMGLVLGIAATFVLDRQDDRLRSASTELAALGVPMLGSAPVSNKSRSGIALFANNSSGADAYRRVQGTLMFNLDKENKSTILVAGIKSSKSSRFVATNIAASIARSGRRTLLIGADLRDNKLHDGPGLSDVVLGKANLSSSIENLGDIDPNFDLLGAGTITSKPTDILQSESFLRLVAAVQSDYDLVLIEAPAVLDVADAMDIARICEGTIVVVDAESESRKDIVESINQVKSVGSEIVGVVVTETSGI